jgi:acylphosphatase
MSDEMADTQCLRFFVSGRVQGVWFRASTREQARRHGITGHARNLPDGRVEVLACGRPAALARGCGRGRKRRGSPTWPGRRLR